MPKAQECVDALNSGAEAPTVEGVEAPDELGRGGLCPHAAGMYDLSAAGAAGSCVTVRAGAALNGAARRMADLSVTVN